jgi:hypothetical protein
LKSKRWPIDLGDLLGTCVRIQVARGEKMSNPILSNPIVAAAEYFSLRSHIPNDSWFHASFFSDYINASRVDTKFFFGSPSSSWGTGKFASHLRVTCEQFASNVRLFASILRLFASYLRVFASNYIWHTSTVLLLLYRNKYVSSNY